MLKFINLASSPLDQLPLQKLSHFLSRNSRKDLATSCGQNDSQYGNLQDPPIHLYMLNPSTANPLNSCPSALEAIVAYRAHQGERLIHQQVVCRSYVPEDSQQHPAWVQLVNVKRNYISHGSSKSTTTHEGFSVE